MHPKTKTLLSSALFALALTAGTTAGAQIKVGHIATTSGAMGALGNDQYDGFMLRVDQNGGMLGGQKISVVRFDDQARPETGLQGARELVERERVDIVVGITAANILAAVYPYVTGAEVPLIHTNGGSSAMAGKSCSPWYVSTAYQSDGVHEAGAQEAKNRGYKNVALIVPNYQAGRDAIAGFKRYYEEGVSDEIYAAMGQTDFSAELTQIAAANPDAVYAFLPGAMGINFVKQYAITGMMAKYPLISSWTVDDLTLRALQDAAVGSTVSSHWTSSSDEAGSKDFVEAFNAKYNRKPSVYAMQGYDAALLIEQALQLSPEAAKNKKALMQALRPEVFKSVRGDIRFNHNGFPIHDYKMWETIQTDSGEYGFKLSGVVLPNHPDPYVSECPVNQGTLN